MTKNGFAGDANGPIPPKRETHSTSSAEGEMLGGNRAVSSSRRPRSMAFGVGARPDQDEPPAPTEDDVDDFVERSSN